MLRISLKRDRGRLFQKKRPSRMTEIRASLLLASDDLSDYHGQGKKDLAPKSLNFVPI